jgi:hypothetical protein
VTERVELPKLELSFFFGCRKEVGGFVKKRLPKCWCSKQTGKQLGWVTAPEMSQQRRKLQGQNETQKKSSNKKCSRVSLSIDDTQMAVLQVSSIWGTVKTFLTISFACSLHLYQLSVRLLSLYILTRSPFCFLLQKCQWVCFSCFHNHPRDSLIWSLWTSRTIAGDSLLTISTSKGPCVTDSGNLLWIQSSLSAC